MLPSNKTFPNSDTTYQPSSVSTNAVTAFGRGDYVPMLCDIRNLAPHSYERVCVDRAIAIALDLALQETRSNATILDVGCAEGLVSTLLATVGYQVTGVDNDVVTSVQGWYDDSARRVSRIHPPHARCQLIRADIRTHVTSPGPKYDVVLLLSVLHHFLEGYGGSGLGKMTSEEFTAFLRSICLRTRQSLYVEVPTVLEQSEMPAASRLSFPEYFVAAGLASDIQLIASTVATNAKARRLYRVSL